MQRVRENVELGVLPGNELPVVPDPTVALIEGGRHIVLSLGMQAFAARAL
jgi:hypothetical protein